MTQAEMTLGFIDRLRVRTDEHSRSLGALAWGVSVPAGWQLSGVIIGDAGVPGAALLLSPLGVYMSGVAGGMSSLGERDVLAALRAEVPRTPR